MTTVDNDCPVPGNDADRPNQLAVLKTASSDYDQAGYLSKLFLGWMDRLIDVSAEKPLEYEDLGVLSNSLTADHLSRRFMEGKDCKFTEELDTFESISSRLFKAFGGGFVASGILKFLGDCAGLTSPIVLKFLLHLIKRKNESPSSITPEDWKTAGALAVTIFLLQVGNSITVNLYFQRTFQCGFKVRVSLTDAIYRKALKLSTKARKDFGPSKIVNLVSVDCARVDLAISFLHYIWSGPFQALVIVGMLYKLLGWCSFIGLGLFLLFFPIQGRIVAQTSIQRKRISQFTDQRLKLMSELITGIKIIKTHAWEEEVMKRVADIRTAEIRNVRTIQALQAYMATITWLVPVMACIGTFLAYRHIHGELPMDLVLPALAYFNLLRIPLILLPVVVGFATDAKVALTRVAELMAAEERSDYIQNVKDERLAIDIEDAEFSWSSSPDSTLETPFKLTLDALRVVDGELVCVVGSIGSGKSSLISALLGEMYLVQGQVCVNKSKKIAYCPQAAWILTGNVRDNIVFGSEFDPVLYERVLDVCQLRTDLELFPSGDLTIIGERGTNLSGGQKQRLSLARAVYSQADIYLFDDPLSALDARVANAIWEECVCGYLAGKTRIVVTHSHRHVSGNRSVHLENGRLVNDLQASGRASPVNNTSNGDVVEAVMTPPRSAKPGERVEDEDRVIGGIQKKVVNQYSNYFGGSMFIMCVAVALVFNQVVKVVSDIWLSSEQNLSGVGERQFALIYGTSGALQGLLVLSICFLFNYGAVSAAIKLHDNALKGLLNSSLGFFEKTSTGRILNRFSRDVDAADNQIAECLRSVAITAIGVLATVFLTIFLSWPSVITVTPALYFFYRIQHRFRPPAREIKRLDALTKAPVFSHISESLSGVQCIRAFADEDRFIRQLDLTIDKNSAPVFLYLSLQRWVSLRLEMVGNLIILSAAVFAFATADVFSFIGLSVVYALNTTGALNWLIRRFSELESQMIACERLINYSDELPQEDDAGQKQVGEEWPSTGNVAVRNLTISYRPDRPPALIDFNLLIKSGEHIGIVGRTGAGKSTIISAFFRLYNASTLGSICIDGVDISQIPLKTLRRRLAIIPQDPVLFSGSVRSNLDPFGKHTDADLWLALDRSGLSRILKRNPGGLEAIVDSHGENWSAGERQLLCLARALLAKSKIILMDEATSSVDPQTDALIQECIAKDLAGSTVLIVAHRLNTIMHCQRVIVLEAGKIIEQGAPHDLSAGNGAFATLLRQQLSEVLVN